MAENTNLAEKEKRSSRKFSFYDFVQLILSNWYWFALSLIICFLCAAFYIRRTAPIYERSASILVKDSRKGSSSEVTAFNDVLGGIGRRSVDNEVHILKSRRLMEEVVKKYDLATKYTTSGRIRTTDLYGRTPALVKFITLEPNKSGSFKYVIDKSGKAVIRDFSRGGGFSATINAGDTIATPLGSIVLIPTTYLDNYAGKEITVTRRTLNDITESYRARLQCNITDKMASVIKISMTDEVPKRAEDVINGIIDAYNNDAITDKQAISTLTEDFINERLLTLGKELNRADSEIASFKQ